MRRSVGWIVVILPCLGAAKTSDGDEPFWVHELPRAKAVGVGARWEISGQPVAPWPVDETAVCTLASRDGDRLTIDVALTRTAKPALDRSGREIRHSLVSYAATCTGSYEVDLSLVLPLRAVMSVRERYRTSMHLGESEARFGLMHDSDCTWRLDFTGGRAGAITPR